MNIDFNWLWQKCKDYWVHNKASLRIKLIAIGVVFIFAFLVKAYKEGDSETYKRQKRIEEMIKFVPRKEKTILKAIELPNLLAPTDSTDSVELQSSINKLNDEIKESVHSNSNYFDSLAKSSKVDRDKQVKEHLKGMRQH